MNPCLDMTLSKEMRRLGSGGRWGLSQVAKRGMTRERAAARGEDEEREAEDGEKDWWKIKMI